MARKKTTYDDLLRMAADYGVQDNALFIAAAEQYELQQKIIRDIKKSLEEDDGLLTTKEYVKGRENLCANPLVAQLPRLTDSANKTLATMLSIVEKLGKEQKVSNPLSVAYK